MQTAKVKKLGVHRGAPRIWFEGKQTSRAGFHSEQRYTIDVVHEKNMVALRISDTGERIVSKKNIKGVDVPVIDINSKEILGMFDGMSAVRVIMNQNEIYILPLATEVRKRERIARLSHEINTSVSIGSISHGGGVLSHAIHSGLKKAGIKSHLAFANDIDSDVLLHAQSSNDAWTDETQFINMPMQELAFDEYVSSKLSKVSILELGIPCAAHSVAARAKKREHVHPEDDPVFGHLAVAFLAIVAKVNPAAIILENVVPYMNSASMGIIRNQLSDMGYSVNTRVLKSADWNCLEARERMCMVAMTDGIDFNFEALQPPEKVVRTLSEILDDVPLDHASWSTMDYLKVKQERDAAKGNSFAMQIFDGSSTKISTLRKFYHKNGSSDPKIRHPQNPNLLRLVNQFEHARAKGIPASIVGDLSKTAAHELLGQSISYDPFLSVGEFVGDQLLKMQNEQEVRSRHRMYP